MNPWESSSFEEGQITDVETARLALRWALEQMRTLQTAQASLRGELQEKTGTARLLQNQVANLESQLRDWEKKIHSWQDAPAGEFLREAEALKRIHANELREERAEQAKLTRDIKELRKTYEKELREERDRHIADHRTHTARVKEAQLREANHKIELGRLARDLEAAWVAAGKHQAELAEARADFERQKNDAQKEAEARFREAEDLHRKALAELAREKEAEFAVQTKEFEGRSHALQDILRKREAELDAREKELFERSQAAQAQASEALSKREAELEAAWAKRHQEMVEHGKKQEADIWAQFNAQKTETRVAAEKHLEAQERALTETFRQKEQALEVERLEAKRVAGEAERFKSERMAERERELAEKEASLEARYQTLFKDIEHKTVRAKHHLRDEIHRITVTAAAREEELAREKTELEEAYRRREAALAEQSLRREQDFRADWERRSAAEKARLEAALAAERESLEKSFQDKSLALESTQNESWMRREAEAAAAHESLRRELEAGFETRRQALEAQVHEAFLTTLEAERRAMETRLAAESEAQAATARAALQKEAEEHERARAAEFERELQALREKSASEGQARDATFGRLRADLEAEFAARREEMQRANEQREKLHGESWVLKEEARAAEFKEKVERARRELEKEAGRKAAEERARLEEEEHAFQTRARATEERLRHLEEDLEKEYRGLSGGAPGLAVEDLVFGIAHQLRTPIAVMHSLAENSLGKRVMRSEDRVAFTAILRSLRTMGRRIEEMVEYSKPITLKAREVEMGPFIDRTLLLVESHCRQQGIQVTVDRAPGLPTVRIDPDQVRNAILHLLFNAVEAMPKGGTLKVTANWSAADRECAVRIEDNGPGIDPELMPDLMRPFFSTKPGGTGLGLAIARKIMLGHAGELRLSSTAGSGTQAECRFHELP